MGRGQVCRNKQCAKIGCEFAEPDADRPNLLGVFGIAEGDCRINESDGVMEAITGEEGVPACRGEVKHLVADRVPGGWLHHHSRSQAVATGDQVGEPGFDYRLDTALEHAVIVVERLVHGAVTPPAIELGLAQDVARIREGRDPFAASKLRVPT